MKLYLAPFQNPESGVISTKKEERSLGFGNFTPATAPVSSSEISKDKYRREKGKCMHNPYRNIDHIIKFID